MCVWCGVFESDVDCERAFSVGTRGNLSHVRGGVVTVSWRVCGIYIEGALYRESSGSLPVLRGDSRGQPRREESFWVGLSNGVREGSRMCARCVRLACALCARHRRGTMTNDDAQARTNARSLSEQQ